MADGVGHAAGKGGGAITARGSGSPRSNDLSGKLKVFQARLGFYDSVVAAPSQAAALRAWGTHQNLFADGEARLTADPAAAAAALAQPNVPLRRPVGTSEPFGLDPGLPHLPNLPDGKTKAKAARPKPTAKPAPDRAGFEAARASLAALEEDRRREEDRFRARRAALDEEEAAAHRRWEAARTKAEAAADRERQAYVESGGKPDDVAL